MAYQVRIVHYGEQGFPGPALFHMGRFGEILSIAFYFWVAQGEGRTLLVDTGVSASGVEKHSANTVARFGKECAWKVPPEKDPLRQLAEMEIAPEDVQTIILTHLHPDHSANLSSFPKAEIVMARRAWEAIHSPPHPNLIKPGTYPPDVMDLLQGEQGGRFRLVEDGEDVVPGIRCYRMGGHSPDQTVVTVDTSAGEVVIASDAAVFYDSLELGWPTASYNMAESLYALDWIRGREAIVLPGHDWEVMERHPGGVIG